MLFHRFQEIASPEPALRGTQDLAVAAAPAAARPGRRELQIEQGRILLALALPALLVIAAIVSFVAGFEAGATAFLHLTEMAVGAIVGAFFGERAAAQSLA
jgi:hypothetical protein